MKYIYPSYYKQFSCIADKCPDTCCAGWGIKIDEKKLAEYKRYPGGFGNRLRNSIDFDAEYFKQYGRRCAFLNDENLCDLYLEAGSDMLCETCKNYPRHTEDYENVREISLSLSCPEAASIILRQDQVQFAEREIKSKEERYEDFDVLLFSQLLDAREACYCIIRNRKQTINQRMMLLLAMGHHLQKSLSQGQLFGLETLYDAYLQPAAGKIIANVMTKRAGEQAERKRFQIMSSMFKKLHYLEVLSSDWPDIVKDYEKQLFTSYEDYQKLSKWQMDPVMKEQLLIYFIYVYFAGAVYDGKPYLKIKLAIVSTLLMEDMLRADVARKGTLTEADYVETIHRYAREVEHSDTNLHRMAVMFGKAECFHINRLMDCLVSGKSLCYDVNKGTV